MCGDSAQRGPWVIRSLIGHFGLTMASCWKQCSVWRLLWFGSLSGSCVKLVPEPPSWRSWWTCLTLKAWMLDRQLKASSSPPRRRRPRRMSPILAGLGDAFPVTPESVLGLMVDGYAASAEAASSTGRMPPPRRTMSKGLGGFSLLVQKVCNLPDRGDGGDGEPLARIPLIPLTLT